MPQLTNAQNSDSDSNSISITNIPTIKERQTEELVFAMVGPMGSGCSKTKSILKEILASEFGYQVRTYQLSQYINESAHLVNAPPPANLEGEEKVTRLQNIGNLLRERFDNKYLAAKTIEDIAQWRHQHGMRESTRGQPIPEKKRVAHIIDSIKHPEELETLQATYGGIFWLVGVFARDEVRIKRLIQEKEYSKKEVTSLIQRDYKEEDIEGKTKKSPGQNVRDVFYQADFFISNNADNDSDLKKSITRFIGILFGLPIHTPTKDETTMHAAYAAAAGSACMSRQVGAAILSPEGNVIGVGRNDVPKQGGGLYEEEDSIEGDNRCYNWNGNHCHNDTRKQKLYKQIFKSLRDENVLKNHVNEDQVTKAIQATDAKALIEYSRAVHAEMDAIISVARANKPGLVGATLYSTTYPCHSCARHIVASGISKVFFIEPYPKSLAKDLHNDAISEDDVKSEKKVIFLQYTGVAPKNLSKLFNISYKRKNNGTVITVDKKHISPIVKVSLDDYSMHEQWVVLEIAKKEESLEEAENEQEVATEEEQTTLPFDG